MACDIARYRKYRHWDTALANRQSDAWSMGFLNKGQVAEYFWAINSTPQAESGWAFVNSGFVLTFSPAANPNLARWSFNFTAGTNLFFCSLLSVGSPTQLIDSGVPYSVTLTLSINIVNPVLGENCSNITFLRTFSPNTVRAFSFNPMSRSGDNFNPAGPPLGSWEIIPLDRCHECTPVS